jgi:hypothetical protein
MPAPKNRRHIFITVPAQVDPFTSRRTGRARPFERPQDPAAHVARLQAGLIEAQRETRARREAVAAQVEGGEPGIFLEFEAPPGVDLKLESLESKRSGIQLVGVTLEPSAPNEPPVEKATVFIPEGKLAHFLSRFEAYATEQTEGGHRKNRDLVDRIAVVRLATIRELWTDERARFPANDESIWWEVWLRRDDGHEVERLEVFAGEAQIQVGARRLAFDDRVVCLAFATPAQLAGSLDVLNDLAELRRAKVGNAFFIDLSPVEQVELAQDLLDRLTPPGPNAPAVCVLDTGVTRAHPLIEPALAPQDASAVDGAWGSHDNGGGANQAGHGTAMAGLALYGDLAPILAGTTHVTVRHRLESVKILPPVGENRPDLYGAIIATAVSRPEIQAPNRRRVFSMAVTAPADGELGQPTSWSAAVDALAAGRMFDVDPNGLVYLDDANQEAHRLFVVSAGNVPPENFGLNHLEISDTTSVRDPAHAWNVLTVGAFTDKALIESPEYDGWVPLAQPGDLSPLSRTGVLLSSKWPNKPDVVCEGGNVAHDGQLFDPGLPEFCLVSTFFRPLEKLFVLSNATSAATAQVARIAAIARAEFPLLWPETIRALVVHSAQWTPRMKEAIQAALNKTQVKGLINRYGFGVPDVSRALRSGNDALTLVAQSVIHPYREGKTREMHVHTLPWPSEVLQQMAEQEVRLRVSLSYFVEPNPARRGWRAKHRYASHGLRFDVKTGEETLTQFRARLNKQAATEDGDGPTTHGDSAKWLLGDKLRHRGSMHSDVWVGTAAELSERDVIGVYPVSGWWKDQPIRDRSELGARYALIVSIETDGEGVDIWTPVAQQVGIPIEEIEIDT